MTPPAATAALAGALWQEVGQHAAEAAQRLVAYLHREGWEITSQPSAAPPHTLTPRRTAVSHPKTADVAALIKAGLTNTAIGEQLHMERQTVGRIRRHLGLPNVPRKPATPEAAWRRYVRDLPEGHMAWTGPVAGPGRTPVLRYGNNVMLTAGRVAYRIQYGADPAGCAKSGCGMPHCVAPAHQLDTGRTRTAGQHHVRYASPEAKLAALVEATDDGHALWTGPVDGPHPLLKHGGRRWPAHTIAFQQHYGRAPVGQVRPGCGVAGCLLGEHLDDRPARERLAAALAALGV